MDSKGIIRKFEPRKENLLSILHAIQNNNPEHFITPEDISEVAKFLGITKGSVYGVITYYSMFSRSPRGKNIIRICHSPVCEMTGKKGILEEIAEILGIVPGETTPDRLFTLETTACLGRCEESPGMIINRKFYGNLSVAGLNEIIEKYRYER